tara:strand:+ start:456 stop:1070 length:615 start_codon:yes stop_codon:yes gene_type:complete
MTSILKADTIQDTDGNNIINENSNTITIGASGDTINVPSGATFNINGTAGTGIGTNTPYFYGELASDATLTRATTTKVTGMTNDELDSATAFDGTTFTVPSGQGGKYYIEGMITGDYGSVGQDGEQTIAFIYKNGSEIKSTKFQSSTSVTATGREITVPISGLFSLSAGDTVEMYAYLQDSSGGNATLQADYGRTSFMGYKIIE